MKRICPVVGGYPVLGGLSNADEPKVRLAVIARPIQDADYGTCLRDYQFLERSTRSDRLRGKGPVPEAEDSAEYIDEDTTSMAPRTPPALKIAGEFPNVIFIAEEDLIPKTIPPNFWYLERNYYIGFYPLGYLATLRTQTGKIGYIGGLDLPFARGEVNAIKQAFRDYKAKVEFDYLFVGDFNDVLKSRQATEGLIAKGVDVIISALNMGNFGMFPAVMQVNGPW
jgi:basic membrane protein A